MKRLLGVSVPLIAAMTWMYLASTSSGQQQQSNQQQQQQLSNADQQFMRQADETDMAEVALGKVAISNSSSPAVKRFGERMVMDHSRANRELREVARSKGIKLPMQLDAKHQQLMQKLSQLNGAAFDREYTKDMVSGHEKAIQKFETEVKNGQDPQVKVWAEKTIPTLKEHLNLARETVKAVK